MVPSAFEKLGLPVSFTVDPGELEKRYLELSRHSHPDHYDPESGKTVEESMRESAALNEAHRVLADPIRRAEHLLALWGGPDASTDKSMPAEFLEQMLEWREQAEDMGQAKILIEQLNNRLDDGLKQLGDAFGPVENDAARRVVRMKEIRQRLNQLRSLRGLLREIEESQDSY